jgi:prepilin-type N-terminal cleavage/methylation domain-containing protein
MKTSQKGFSVVEVLLVVVVIGLIGAVGWLVYERQQNDKTDEKSTITETNQPTGETSKKVPDGWSEYSDNNYYFIHPVNWSEQTPKEKDVLTLKSPDYSETSEQGERGPYPILKTGYKLDLSVIPDDTQNETLEKLTAHIVEEEGQLGGGSHKEITVDGHKAMWVNNKYEETYLYAIVFHDSKRVHIQLNTKDDTNPEAISLFEKILNSLDIK